jgi:hypothetical protein
VLQQAALLLPSMIIDEKDAIHTVLPLYGQPVSKAMTLMLSVFVLTISILFLLSFIKITKGMLQDYEKEVKISLLSPEVKDKI